jgi:hypothetical protein
MRDFRQIKVWVKAHRLTLEIYKGTAQFPREELYGLTSQLAGRPPQFRQILRRVLGGEVTRSWPDSCKLGSAQPTSVFTTHLPEWRISVRMERPPDGTDYRPK